MSKSQPVSEADTATPSVENNPKNPLKNPAYPQRTHIGERAIWQTVVAECDAKILPASQKLSTLADAPSFPVFERLHAQMLGARDQVADAARRLPGETGDLYVEDKHRLEEAVSALNRALSKWDEQKF